MADGDVQRRGKRGPDVYRFRDERGHESAYVRHNYTLNLALNRPRLTIKLPGEAALRDLCIRRDHNAYHLALDEGTEPPKESAHSIEVPNLQFDCEGQPSSGQSLGSIDKTGTRKYERSITVSIQVGPRNESSLRYYKASSEAREQLYVLLLLPPEEMKCLQAAFAERADANVSADLVIPSYQLPSGISRDIYVEADQSLRVIDFSVVVSDSGATSAARLERMAEVWLGNYREHLWEGNVRIAPAVECCVEGIAASSVRTGKDGPHLFDHMRALIDDLDSDLRNPHQSPFKSDKTLWRHIDSHNYLEKTSVQQRAEFFKPTTPIHDYVASPELHNDYFDWVVLDILVAHKLTALFEAVMRAKYGGAYTIVGHAWWMLQPLRVALVALSIALGWVLPGVVFYFVAIWSVWLGVVLAVLYYGLAIAFSLYWLGLKIWRILTGTPSMSRLLMTQLIEVERLYQLLEGPVLHAGTVQKGFNRTMEKGVAWDQAVFYILDSTSKRSPKLWQNTLFTSSEMRDAVRKVAPTDR